MRTPGPYAAAAIAASILLNGAAWQAVAAGTGTVTVLRGRIVDDEGHGVAGAEVVACRGDVPGAIVVNRDSGGCAVEVARAPSTTTGAFTLSWKAGASRGAVSVVIVRRSGYVTPTISLEKAKTQARLSVQLSKAPSALKLRVLRGDGTPVADAEYGWFVEEGAVLRVRHVHCCTNRQGELDLAESALAAGSITAFAIEPGSAPRFGLVEIDTRTENSKARDIPLREPLTLVRGTAVGTDGSAISALVDVEPLDIHAASTFDRVLMAIRPRETDTMGTFTIRLSSPLPVRLRLATWTSGLGTREAHVGERPIGELTVTVPPSGSPIILRTRASPIVTCELKDRTGRALGIDRLGLQFGPHVGWGHSGACVDIRSAEEEGKGTVLPAVVRFIWPEATKAVSIIADGRVLGDASSAGQDSTGSVVLKNPSQPCHIVVQGMGQ